MRAAREPAGDVVIRMSYDEALVLSDLLHRWEQDDTQEALSLDDEAEQRLIWNLTACFEPVIDEVFNEDYHLVVDGARAAVRGAS